MRRWITDHFNSLALTGMALGLGFGCGAPPAATNVNVALANNGNTAINSNAIANLSNSVSNSTSSISDIKEPDSYQAIVDLRLEATGDQQSTALPTIKAKVARNGQNRRMEFTVPGGGQVIFLDLNGTNLLIMPDRKQYAELDRESMGFEARRLLMPEEIVRQLQTLPGVRRGGEERYNGRDAVRYDYGSVTNTGTQAGQVSTNSFFLVDKLTGLPLRSELASKSSSGANVQGYNGVRIITEISDITNDAPPELFDRPANFQKIDPQQVRAQVDLIFNSIAAVITQIINQNQSRQSSNPPAGNSTSVSPTP